MENNSQRSRKPQEKETLGLGVTPGRCSVCSGAGNAPAQRGRDNYGAWEEKRLDQGREGKGNLQETAAGEVRNAVPKGRGSNRNGMAEPTRN